MRSRWYVLVAALMIGTSAAQASSNTLMYYWEREAPGYGLARHGWSDSPRGVRVSGPVEPGPGESLWSVCARLVGRTMLTDDSNLALSTTMTDACVRNGGRL